MNERIIYLTDEGIMAVIIPAVCGLTVEEIAVKDVPTGKPYKIVDVSELPADRATRAEWTVSEADLTGGVGG